MIDVIEQQRALDALCRSHRVKTLEVFGSAADGTFDVARSDLDFLVEFLPLESGQYADAYFGLLFGLEDLFKRKIDLVMPGAIRNPYLLEAINDQRKVLYAA
jgi:predicted nucleotidyltransferase